MRSTPLRVSAVQFESMPGDIPGNLERVDQLTAAASADGAELIVMPEMCLPGYWHLRRRSRSGLLDLAQEIGGPTVGTVREMAMSRGVGIGVGFLEREGDALYNSYAVCLPDGAVHCHRKLHSFEHEAISSGSRFTVFDTPWEIKVGILVCWDNNLVENVRATALLGADVLVAPHQTGGTLSRSPHGMSPVPPEIWHNRQSDPAAIEKEIRGPRGREWLMRWLPSRAHDNGLFLVFSNGIGVDDDEIRTGNAMIIDPYGRIIAETWAARDDIVTADLDFSLLEMSTGRRWIGGRRPELYDILTHRFGNERDARTTRFSTEPPNAVG